VNYRGLIKKHLTGIKKKLGKTGIFTAKPVIDKIDIFVVTQKYI